MLAEDFDAYYHASYGKMVGQLTAMCGSRSEAEDCVQEAYVRAWERRERFDADANPDAWIRTVAWRLAVSRFRRHRRDSSLTDQDRATAAPGLDHVALQAALASIPTNHRRAIVLHYMADLAVEDIGRELDAAPATVRQWLSRGRAKLAGLLDDQEERHG